jgi:hypothetical protein
MYNICMHTCIDRHVHSQTRSNTGVYPYMHITYSPCFYCCCPAHRCYSSYFLTSTRRGATRRSAKTWVSDRSQRIEAWRPVCICVCACIRWEFRWHIHSLMSCLTYGINDLCTHIRCIPLQALTTTEPCHPRSLPAEQCS